MVCQNAREVRRTWRPDDKGQDFALIVAISGETPVNEELQDRH